MSNDACDGLLGILALGGMFFFGKKLGERRTIQYYEDSKRDEEINKLKKELEMLKNQSTNQIS